MSALRILIVDDSDVARRILATIVRSRHWDVCGEAEDGWSGVKKFHELKPDLVLLDLTLPGMTGTETATALKLELPHVKIILFTFHADGVNQSLASTFNIDRVISKSESIRTLGEHLKALLTPVNEPRRLEGVTEGQTARRDQPS